MNVSTTFTGEHRDRRLEWLTGWPIPREGEEITLADGAIVFVRTVVWYPEGSDDGEPFVYLVLGPRRQCGATEYPRG